MKLGDDLIVYIEGYEGRYAETTSGKTYSFERDIFLKPCKKPNGYLFKNSAINKPYSIFNVFFLRRPLYTNYLSVQWSPHNSHKSASLQGHIAYLGHKTYLLSI